MLDLPIAKVPIVDYGPEQSAMERYRREGEERARQRNNRGPLRFDANGNLDPAILEAYSRLGFYIFERLVNEEERKDIERDVFEILARAPFTKDAKVDRQGARRWEPTAKLPVLPSSSRFPIPSVVPSCANGRHPVKMNEPTPPKEAPEYVVQLVLGSLQFSDACLRLYGHPQLLKVAETINGKTSFPSTRRFGSSSRGWAVPSRGIRMAGRTGPVRTSTRARTASTS